MIVDSHQHFWDLEKVDYPWLVPEYGPIYRAFTPHELAPQLAAAGIDRDTWAILMVPPGIDLFVLTFTLFRIGAVPAAANR